MSLSCGPEIRLETERRFSPIAYVVRCYKLLEIERTPFALRATWSPCYACAARPCQGGSSVLSLACLAPWLAVCRASIRADMPGDVASFARPGRGTRRVCERHKRLLADQRPSSTPADTWRDVQSSQPRAALVDDPRASDAITLGEAPAATPITLASRLPRRRAAMVGGHAGADRHARGD
jgi:hypothetical protein